MERSELIALWLRACELAKARNNYAMVDDINDQLGRFILTGLLPWETESSGDVSGDSFANFEPSAPAIKEAMVGFCPTTKSTESAVPYGTL